MTMLNRTMAVFSIANSYARKNNLPYRFSNDDEVLAFIGSAVQIGVQTRGGTRTNTYKDKKIEELKAALQASKRELTRERNNRNDNNRSQSQPTAEDETGDQDNRNFDEEIKQLKEELKKKRERTANEAIIRDLKDEISGDKERRIHMITFIVGLAAVIFFAYQTGFAEQALTLVGIIKKEEEIPPTLAEVALTQVQAARVALFGETYARVAEYFPLTNAMNYLKTMSQSAPVSGVGEQGVRRSDGHLQMDPDVEKRVNMMYLVSAIAMLSASLYGMGCFNTLEGLKSLFYGSEVGVYLPDNAASLVLKFDEDPLRHAGLGGMELRGPLASIGSKVGRPKFDLTCAMMGASI